MEVCLVHPAAAVVSEFPAATSRGDADVSAEARRVDESDPAPDPLLHLRGARTAACNEEIREPPGALREVAGATAGGEAEVRAAWRRHRTDRKSTRLNSSHLVISYAVFCLKKKTK